MIEIPMQIKIKKIKRTKSNEKYFLVAFILSISNKTVFFHSIKNSKTKLFLTFFKSDFLKFY